MESKCKICDKPTNIVFNINMEAVPICEPCADSIMAQQVMWYKSNKPYCKKCSSGA